MKYGERVAQSVAQAARWIVAAQHTNKSRPVGRLLFV